MTLDAAFSHLETLTTARLCIRPITTADAEAAFSFKSNADSSRCFGQDPQLSVQETRAWIERNLADYGRRGSMTWALTFKSDDAAIGECCFWNFDPSFQCAELGYELHPDHGGQGLMREALEALIAYGFLELGLHRIEADPLASNERSTKLLLRLGFRSEGALRERVFFHGRYEDQLFFALLQDEWRVRSGEGSAP